MTRSEKPKANATPVKPMWPPARTAAPQPPKTRTKVPISSATYLFIPLLLRRHTRADRFPRNCLSRFPLAIPNDSASIETRGDGLAKETLRAGESRSRGCQSTYEAEDRRELQF